MKLNRIILILGIIGYLGLSVMALITVRRENPTLIAYGDSKLSTGSFVFDNELNCMVVDQKDSIGTWLPSSQGFELRKLDEEIAEMAFSGFPQQGLPMQKIYDIPQKVVIEFSENGNTQIVSLNKDSGIFVRTITGHSSGPGGIDFEYAIAQNGRCE